MSGRRPPGVTAIAFSYNRAAQLDLLLRSGRANAGSLFVEVDVIVRAEGDFLEAYKDCHRQHCQYAAFRIEGDGDFRVGVLGSIERARDHIVFFVDDDVIYRKLPLRDPSVWLNLFPDTLCFSLRMGMNCVECYSMREEQGVPFAKSVGEFVHWEWRHASARHDWAYPGSLDGHIFRRDDLLRMLKDETFANPNQLEEALVRGCRATGQREIAAFKQSVLVGVPLNSVSETHASNRHSETPAGDPAALNAMYLKGRRLALDLADVNLVRAAHAEFPVRWEEQA